MTPQGLTVVVPQLDTDAIRRSGRVLLGAGVVLFALAAVSALSLGLGKVGWILGSIIGVVAGVWFVLAGLMFAKASGGAPEFLGRVVPGGVEVGTPVQFRWRSRGFILDAAVPVVVSVAHMKSGLARNTNWLLSGSIKVGFVTAGFATDEHVAQVEQGLRAIGFRVEHAQAQ